MSEELRSRSLKKLETPNSCQHRTLPGSTQSNSHHDSPIPTKSFLLTAIELTSIEALEFLHRGPESVLTLHAKRDGFWEDLGGIRICELQDKLPAVRKHLESDSYFSINSTYPQRYLKGFSGVTGLPLYSRREKNLRWLNALPLDLDIGHDGTPFCFECLTESFLLEVQNRGLPDPSAIVSSGRGLWSLWRIANRLNREQPVRAFPDQCDRYRQTIRSLARQFEHLGADVGVVDPARVMRIPQTSNTKAPEALREVHFYKISEDCHSLAEFDDILGIVRNIRSIRPQAGRKDEVKVRAGLERWRRPLAGFEKLSARRRCFAQGTRHAAIYINALLLRKNRVHEEEILVRCRELAKACRPPLDERDVRRCVFSSRKHAALAFERSISNDAIARMLHITQKEKAAIPEWFGRQRKVRSSKGTDIQPLIEQVLRQAGVLMSDRKRWLSTRLMSRILREQHGVSVSHVTVGKNYQKLFARWCSTEQSQVKAACGNFPGG